MSHTRSTRRVNIIVYSCGVCLLLIGLYILWVIAQPWLTTALIDARDNPTTRHLATSQADPHKKRLYIPKINVDVSYQNGDASQLEHGAWWRKPEHGNPRAGGNFIISAHRFIMGLTPQQTARKSPFFSIDRLTTGDPIYVDYGGVRYTYRITTIHQVAPSATEIEAATPQRDQLTLYSCTLGGSSDGRTVIVADKQP